MGKETDIRHVLTDLEIEQLYAENQGMMEFARNVEAAVILRYERNHDRVRILSRAIYLYKIDELAHTLIRSLADFLGKRVDEEFIMTTIGNPPLLSILEDRLREKKDRIDESMRKVDPLFFQPLPDNLKQ